MTFLFYNFFNIMGSDIFEATLSMMNFKSPYSIAGKVELINSNFELIFNSFSAALTSKENFIPLEGIVIS